MFIVRLTRNRGILFAVLLALLVSSFASSAGTASAGAGDCYGWGFEFAAGPSGAEGTIGVMDSGLGKTLEARNFLLDPNETRTEIIYVIVPSGSVFAYAAISSGTITPVVMGWVADKFCAPPPPPPGPDMVPIPPQAVMGTFTTSTPLYFAPEVGAETEYVMEAGQSLWVYGLDNSGQFYQVLLSGGTYWVPVGTIGATFDELWNGAPLPTSVVTLDSEG